MVEASPGSLRVTPLGGTTNVDRSSSSQDFRFENNFYVSEMDIYKFADMFDLVIKKKIHGADETIRGVR